MKHLVEKIIAKQYVDARTMVQEALVRIATDSIEKRKIEAGSTFFESVNENSLEEENLQEISRKTLGSYLKKAGKLPVKQLEKREKGVRTAAEKMGYSRDKAKVPAK